MAQRDTKERLITAARDLFADRGVDGVSLREIAREAGQSNTSALQYYFDGRSALVAEILSRYRAREDDRRAALLEALDSPVVTVDLRDVAGALVRPAAALLEVEGGGSYLRIMSELWRDPRRHRGEGLRFERDLASWRALAAELMPSPASTLHRRFAAIQLCYNELGRRAAARRRRDHRLFVSDLVDQTTGLLAAPISDETRKFLDERESRV